MFLIHSYLKSVNTIISRTGRAKMRLVKGLEVIGDGLERGQHGTASKRWVHILAPALISWGEVGRGRQAR